MIHSLTFFLRKISTSNRSDVLFQGIVLITFLIEIGAHVPGNINNDDFQSSIMLKSSFLSEWLT